MKHFFSFFFLGSSLVALEQTTQLNLEYINYDKYHNEILLEGNSKLSFTHNSFETKAMLLYLYSSEYVNRRYVALNELYVHKEWQNTTFEVGKSIKFWGELEGFNIADIYNQKNYTKDPFDKDAKLGSYGTNVSYYLDESSLAFGVKLYEQNIDYPDTSEPYSPFALSYDNNLQLSNSKYTPSLYALYSFASEFPFESETKLLLWHGYDNKRSFTLLSPTTLAQYSYRVTKLALLSHILHDDYIFKTELVYTDVSKYEAMSDYAQLSCGVERSFYNLYGADTGLYLEYYHYIYSDDSKIKNVDISEVYDHDVFLALKTDLNNVNSTTLQVGMLYDTHNAEQIRKIEFSTRIFDTIILSAHYLQTITKAQTLLHDLRDTSRASFSLGYSF